MHDLHDMRQLEAQGCPACEGRLRAVRAWPSMEIYRTAEDVRPPQASPCGGDCKACGLAEGDGLGINRQGEVR